MRTILALVVVLLAAPLGAAAQEYAQPQAPLAPRAPVTELVATAPVEAQVVQEPVRAEAREAREEVAKRDQFAQRGSFWWLVGVIVIAGVLLAVLLD
ncbi:MAG TPA: hypothetical protein VHG28_01895 [Longimicrobiaceae bacterium]|nr:hypothetical protein [Longimicrobiaceae bacterium]